jgi:glycerol-3-phosphate acyltransferase PlsY
MILLQALLLGYLLGTIPFGLFFTWLSGAGDVRKIGSGNIGATNVLRTGRRELAALTLVLDAAKGFVAVMIARYFWPGDAIFIAGIAVFLGHCFPVWLGFKGGKGVATYLGVLIGLAWQVALIFAIVWLAIAYLFRFSSLAALTAAVVVPIALYFMSTPQIAALFVVMSIIVFIKHRANISRLLAGTEGKIGAKG